MNFDCRMCGASFAAVRSSARYCGATCRQRAKTARDAGLMAPEIRIQLPVLLCSDCGARMMNSQKRAIAAVPLCRSCRRQRRALKVKPQRVARTKVFCARCGRRVQTSRLSAASPTCRDCLRAIAAEWTAKRCDECGDAFTAEHRTRRFCSLSCASRNKVRLGLVVGRPRTRPLEHPKVKRHHRERAAPGLTAGQRSHLLHKWQRDGRTCTYCGGACETVDHIIALVRGGTNYEGNLTPACRSCNGSKGARTLVEWKHGRPAAQFNDSRPWMVLAA